jgi:hypothetical protein
MVQPGFFVLHPAVLPPVPAGPYTLHGEVEDMPPGPVAPLDTHISVSSPRYTMPPDQILSTFPPANGEGAYRATLPQIVLKRRTLPWERKVDADERIPWLALVVIAEGEGSLSAESPIEQCISDFSKVPQPSDRDVATSVYLSVTQTVVNGVFPCKEDLELLAHVREVDLSDSELASGDDDGFLAVVVANRLPQPGFDEATGPTPKKYLACLINLETQVAVLPPPTPDNALVHEFDALAVVQDLRPAAQALINDPDHFAMGTVTAFDPGGRDSARRGFAAGSPPRSSASAYIGAADSVDPVSHAVRTGSSWSPSPAAIEQAAVSYAATDAARLVRDAMAGGWRLPIEAIVLEPTYRFPVLAHWSFTVTGDATFEQYMQHLDVGLLGTLEGDTPPLTPEERSRQAKTAAPPADARPDPELAETGHVGLAHQTRRGDHVRAWFRGPASPHPTKRETAPTTGEQKGRLPFAHTSDQLRIVVPDGREDVSYASAFEIGRLLALSQPAVVSALLRWRQEQFGAQRAAMLAALAAAASTFFDDGIFANRDAGLGALLGRHTVLGAAAKADTVFAGSRPLVPAGRRLDFADGDLDEIVADGLGLSLAVVQRNSKRLGLLGALTATQVQVAEAGEPALDGAAFASLQSHLDAQVDALAAQVDRRQVDGPPTGRAGARDALDELLGQVEDHRPEGGDHG